MKIRLPGELRKKRQPDGRFISALSARDAKLMLLDVARQTWTAQGPKYTGWQCWSKDSKFVYFLVFDGEPGVFRVSVDNNTLEKILDLKSSREVGTWGGGSP